MPEAKYTRKKMTIGDGELVAEGKDDTDSASTAPMHGHDGKATITFRERK